MVGLEASSKWSFGGTLSSHLLHQALEVVRERNLQWQRHSLWIKLFGLLAKKLNVLARHAWGHITPISHPLGALVNPPHHISQSLESSCP